MPTPPRKVHRHAAPLAAVVLAVMLGASVARAGEDVVPSLPAADASALAAKLGPGVVGHALPSAPIASASRYFPLEARTRSYRVTDGARKDTTVQLAVARGARPNGTPAWRLQLTPSLEAFLHAAPDGDLLLTAMADSGEGLVVVTTPPSGFLIEGLEPGRTRTVAQSVAVKYLDDPGDARYTGTLTSEYTHLGTFAVEVPAGSYQAALVRHRHTGTVGPADTQDTAYYLLAPGVGVVAMVTQEDIEAFWVIHLDTSTGKVLAAE
jgi:hypothetical protein